MGNTYDVIVLGCGPAGLTAAIYALRSGCSVLLVESNMIGGQATLTYEIKNYPGFEEISGMELAMKMHEQAEKLGAETTYGEIEKVDLENKEITLNGEIFSATSIVLCMGASARKLGVKNEKELTGRGVAYCAICDGAFFRDKKVVLVGGGNTAVEDAIYLSNICSSVTVVNNLDDFTCQKVLKDQFEKVATEKELKALQGSIVKEIKGNDVVEGVVVADRNGVETVIGCDGVFVAIGRVPDTSLVQGQIETNKNGYIIADENMHTSVEGVFVAGDVRVKNLRQIITACGDGAIAGTEASTYVNHKR